MDILYKYQAILLQNIDDNFKRYLFEKINWVDRFVGIKGLRGVGKTTMLLQYLKYELKDLNRNLYVSLDHPYFYKNSLENLAEEFYLNGGEVLLVDEIHKMEHWSKSIKYIYDTFPKLQLILSSSSSLDILRGEADLSRRLILHDLAGLSFREFIEYKYQVEFSAFTLSDIIKNHQEISKEILRKVKPIPLLNAYLEYGYYPFAKSLSFSSFQSRLMQTLDTTLNVDMAYINNFSPENTFKIKKLLGVIVESPPFSINVSSIAQKLGIGRNTVKNYLHALENAGILNFLSREGKGISVLQKPDKIYLENTNLAFTLKSHNDKGNIRETFALNQLKNAGFEVNYPKVSADFYLVEEDVLLEIGGKNKGNKQLNWNKNGCIFSDGLEIGYQNKIPLYLLGFLY